MLRPASGSPFQEGNSHGSTNYSVNRVRAIDSVIANGGKAYDRGRMLVRVLPLGPDDISGNEPETTRRIVLKLASALRTERARGRAGHWT